MSKKEPTSYEVSDEELVRRLMRAAGEAGEATSGSCYDPFAGHHVADMHYYRGVVLARLAGKKPPHEPGARVVVCDTQGAKEKSYRGPSLSFRSEHVVRRVWYVGDNWYLELMGVEGNGSVSPLYRAAAFQLATSENNTVTVTAGGNALNDQCGSSQEKVDEDTLACLQALRRGRYR